MFLAHTIIHRETRQYLSRFWWIQLAHFLHYGHTMQKEAVKYVILFVACLCFQDTALTAIYVCVITLSIICQYLPPFWRIWMTYSFFHYDETVNTRAKTLSNCIPCFVTLLLYIIVIVVRLIFFVLHRYSSLMKSHQQKWEGVLFGLPTLYTASWINSCNCSQ